MAKITSSNWQNYVDRGIATHGKNMYAQDGSPSVQAAYGTFDSQATAHKTLCAIYSSIPFADISENTRCASIPRGFTIAVEENGTVVEYQYKKTMPDGGYNMYDQEVKVTVGANDISYNAGTTYSSGTIGKAVKDLSANVSTLDGKIQGLDKPTPTPSSSVTSVDLSNYVTAGASFTYDIDNKYVYNSKDTTFYQYSEVVNNETKYYGVFKVMGEDAYIRYTISNYTTFTYENTYTEALLPENAKKEFALGTLAVVKRVNGEGESWQNGTVNLFCTKQNMALRNRCKNVTLNGTTAWRVLIKSEDGNTIFVYKAKSNGNYEHETNVTRSSVADFNMLDNYFDEKQVAAYSESSTIANPTQNIFYNLMGTGSTPTTITSLDISGIGVTNPNEVTILFKTHAEDTCSLTALATQRVLGSTSLGKGQVYVMSIVRGIACIVEAPLYELPV